MENVPLIVLLALSTVEVNAKHAQTFVDLVHHRSVVGHVPLASSYLLDPVGLLAHKALILSKIFALLANLHVPVVPMTVMSVQTVFKDTSFMKTNASKAALMEISLMEQPASLVALTVKDVSRLLLIV